MDDYSRLPAFSETVPVLKELRNTGFVLGVLSNGSQDMLDVIIEYAGLDGVFQHVLSVDSVRLYKTAAAAYALGPRACDCAAQDILFVSLNGGDVCAATWYGYTTFWVNRHECPAEQMAVVPHGQGHTMDDLIEFLRRGAER